MNRERKPDTPLDLAFDLAMKYLNDRELDVFTDLLKRIEIRWEKGITPAPEDKSIYKSHEDRLEVVKQNHKDDIMAEQHEIAQLFDPNHESPESILRAVRHILRTKEGASILERAVTVMRRYDSLRKGRVYKDE